MSNVIIDNIEFHDSKPTIDLSFKRLVEIGDMRSELRISGGETGNVAVKLDNGDGSITKWANQLLLKQATVVNETGRTFSGIVRSIRVSESISIVIEA